MEIPQRLDCRRDPFRRGVAGRRVLQSAAQLGGGVSIIPAAGQTIGQYWNIAAFSVPAAKTWGNLGHYIGRGPGFYMINSALEKRFPVTERLSGTFRIEAFSLFNHAILNNPAANISMPATFGRITGSSGQRNLQFIVRVEF